MAVTMIKRENDWCFLCEQRRNRLVAINYPFENENQKNQTQFIRVCLDCLKRAMKITDDNKIPINTLLED